MGNKKTYNIPSDKNIDDFLVNDKGEMEYLSPAAELRYLKMEEDRKKGINWHTANSLEEFFEQLLK